MSRFEEFKKAAEEKLTPADRELAERFDPTSKYGVKPGLGSDPRMLEEELGTRKEDIESKMFNVDDFILGSEWTTDPSTSSQMEGTIWDYKKLQKNCQLTPLRDRVVMRKRGFKKFLDVGEKKILISAKNTEDDKSFYADQGMIVFVGPDVVNVRPGDEVLTLPYEGRDVVGRDGTTYHIIPESGITALVSNENMRKLKPIIQVQYEQQQEYDKWFQKNSKKSCCNKK